MRQRPGSPDATHPPPAAAETVWLEADLDTVEENLALDEALLEEAHEGLAAATVVRTWMAREPVVVVGSSSRLEEEIDRMACESSGVRILRRPSGGLTVVLGPGCLMWSVVMPHPAGAPPVDRIHADMLEPLRGALAERLAPAGTAVDRRGSSDLVAVREGVALKFSGNALRVRRHGVLYHGTLLDDFDIPIISRVLRHPPREPDYRRRRTHGEFLTNLNLGRITLETLVRRAFRAVAVRTAWPRDRVERLVRERYGRDDWTNRL